MKRLFLFLTVAAAVCCAACSDDPEVAESNLSLLEDNVTFDMFGGRSVLEITADSPWTVSCQFNWCGIIECSFHNVLESDSTSAGLTKKFLCVMIECRLLPSGRR